MLTGGNAAGLAARCAAVLAAVIIAASAAGTASASNAAVIPLRSELSTGSFVNLTISANTTVVSASGGVVKHDVSGYSNYTATSVNSTSYIARLTSGDYNPPEGIYNTVTFNFTGLFNATSMSGVPIPYLNTTLIDSLNTTKAVSYGTFDYHSRTVPMEKVRDGVLKEGHYTVTSRVVEFDTYSGVVLSSVVHLVFNTTAGGGGVQYVNETGTLNATSFAMGAPHAPASLPYLPILTIVVISAAASGAAAVIVRRRRHL